MLTRMKDIFRLPPSPFSPGKTSFNPVTAAPIKVPARRLSTASHEGLAKPFLPEPTASDDNDELMDESEEDQANESIQEEQVERENEEDLSEEEVGDELKGPQEREQLTESPLVEADSSEDEGLESSIVPRRTHNVGVESMVTIPPPTTQARKRRLSVQNGENTGKRKKSRKSELTKGKPTIADADDEDATPSQTLSKRERKEARRRKREQKAERKMARDSTVATSQDLESVHSVENQSTVAETTSPKIPLSPELGSSGHAAAPKSNENRGKSGFEIFSSPEHPSLGQQSPDSIAEKTQGGKSGKKRKKATLETSNNEAEQLNLTPETQEPTPEQSHQDSKTSNKPAKKAKTSRKTPNSIYRTPPTPRSRSSLSAARIINSSASEDGLSDHSPLPTLKSTPKPQRRKVGDLVHLQSPQIGVDKLTPSSDGKQTPSTMKRFSPEEDARLRNIIKQYKEVIIPKCN